MNAAMQLLTYASGAADATRILSLMHERGIPTWTESTRLPGTQNPMELAVFVCIDDQFDDARALLVDPDHVVRDPVDVAEFEARAANVDLMPMLSWGAAVAAVLFLFVVALYNARAAP